MLQEEYWVYVYVMYKKPHQRTFISFREITRRLGEGYFVMVSNMQLL